MVTPVKACSFLSNPKIISPVASGFLSPLKHKKNISEAFLSPCRTQQAQTKILNYGVKTLEVQKLFGKHSKNLKNNSVDIRIEKDVDDYNLQHQNKGYAINSPNKVSLLKDGLSKLIEHDFGIGKGAFGTVIKGEYKVKIVNFHDSSEISAERNALNLNHNNIVSVYDIVLNKLEKRALIFMEYVNNSRNLQEILNGSRWDLNNNVLFNFCKGITRGIDFCHKNDILHLDIKPKNILVCGDICKICDFGNSLKISANISVLNYNYKGTVAYTAPEILTGGQPTIKSDVYSLGILFWQMRSRKTPYENLENDVIIYKVVKNKFRPNVDFYEEEDEFSILYSSCWQNDPENRPSTRNILTILDTL